MFSFFKKPDFNQTGSGQAPRILFVSSGAGPDYQCDMIFHGLKKLYGRGVFSSSEMVYMYADISSAQKAALYGKGFTVYGNIDPTTKNVMDSKEIPRKIKKGYFDKIVFGSIHREQRYLDEAVRHIDRENILLVDGEDETTVLEPLKRVGRYFKREMLDSETEVHPIQFCMPSEKIALHPLQKTKTWATIIPGKLETYVFDDERKYYADYQQSVYAHTCKKAGWDCLRHYEIIANGCIPKFAGLEQCPENTLFRFPRDFRLMSSAAELSAPEAIEFTEYLVNELKSKMTTEAMAGYLLKA